MNAHLIIVRSVVEWIIALDFKSVVREFESRLSLGIFVVLLIFATEALTFFQSSKVRGKTKTKQKNLSEMYV